MAELSSEWNNEAYVSLHLVEEMLRMAGLPSRSSYSHWYPQYKIENLKGSKKWWVDFYIEDFTNFSGLVLNSQGQIVKSVSSKITERGFQTQGIWFGDLPKGMYVVKLTTNDREKFYKIIKY